ncbi:hypothetical protein WJX82_004144 [Trebouxia sp. C0006]
MRSRCYLINARNITVKPVQHLGAALEGLQQLCNWAAKPLEGRMHVPQNTALAVEHAPLQTSRQVSTDPAAADPAAKHGQRNVMPRWPERQQATEAVGFQSGRHMTNYIKTQWQLAAHFVRLSSPDKIMEAYYIAFESTICLKNRPSRLPGSERFRQQLLKRRGKLVLLAPPKAGVGVKEVAEYLKPILTAAAGGSLDAYRR